MSNTNTGGPAFPQVELDRVTGGPCDQHFGMTLRDYFAAKAMPAVYVDYCESARQLGFDEGWKDGVAIDAYAMADAMLKARKS